MPTARPMSARQPAPAEPRESGGLSARRPVSARPALHASGGPYSARPTAVYNVPVANLSSFAGAGDKESNARMIEWYGLSPRGMDPSLRPPSERRAGYESSLPPDGAFGSMVSVRRLQPRTTMELMIERHHQPAVAARRNAPAPPPPGPAVTPRPAATFAPPATHKPQQVVRRAPSPPKVARAVVTPDLRPTTRALRPPSAPAVPTPAVQRPNRRKSKDGMGAPVTVVAVAGAPGEEQAITPNWAVLGEQTAAAPAHQPRLDRFSRYVGA